MRRSGLESPCCAHELRTPEKIVFPGRRRANDPIGKRPQIAATPAVARVLLRALPAFEESRELVEVWLYGFGVAGAYQRPRLPVRDRRRDVVCARRIVNDLEHAMCRHSDTGKDDVGADGHSDHPLLRVHRALLAPECNNAERRTNAPDVEPCVGSENLASSGAASREAGGSAAETAGAEARREPVFPSFRPRAGRPIELGACSGLERLRYRAGGGPMIPAVGLAARPTQPRFAQKQDQIVQITRLADSDSRRRDPSEVSATPCVARSPVGSSVSGRGAFKGSEGGRKLSLQKSIVPGLSELVARVLQREHAPPVERELANEDDFKAVGGGRRRRPLARLSARLRRLGSPPSSGIAVTGRRGSRTGTD